jgi:hypothetical protein
MRCRLDVMAYFLFLQNRTRRRSEGTRDAMGRGKEISRELRALPSSAAQISTESHGHGHSSHEGSRDDHR